MKKRKLLIATTNDGKLKEIESFFETLPFELITLSDLDKDIEEPEETEETIEGNAILKARYYGEKTGLLTLADDAGLFIDGLGGWPGVKSARVAETSDEQCKVILEKMKNVSEGKRSASFQLALTLYNPENKSVFVVSGKTDGKILDQVVENDIKLRYGYNRIFFVEELGKTYAEMAIAEKNAVSHRGKALSQMKYHLQKTFGANHFVVPQGLLIKDGKIFIQKRNDPHRPEFHGKWEFPGGSVEFGESIEENLLREVKEESGYDVEIVRLLQNVRTVPREYPDYSYQVYLLPYVCRVTGGEGSTRDEEVLETAWVGLDEMLEYDLMGANFKVYEKLLPELKEVISKYKL